MKLSEARNVFQQCKDLGEQAFSIRRHCWVDHPERKFTRSEILILLLGRGHLKLNQFPSAKPNSFLWTCKDDYNLQVEIAVVIDGEKIKATAISAYRDPNQVKD